MQIQRFWHYYNLKTEKIFIKKKMIEKKNEADLNLSFSIPGWVCKNPVTVAAVAGGSFSS